MMITLTSILGALCNSKVISVGLEVFPERKRKNPPQASILNGFLIKLMM